MAGETVITIVGNIVAEPSWRSVNTRNGQDSVVNFRVASTPSSYNRDTGKWEDGDALFMSCTAWRQMADNIRDSLGVGARVIVRGRLQQRSYVANDGSNRQVMEMQVDEIGASLRYATAQITRTSSGSGNSSSYSPASTGPASSAPSTSGGGDAWSDASDIGNDLTDPDDLPF
ncbi:MAG: single-stranded DNA-binding protein [Candidatus Ancillula sp.]|jgi:single-strand DNA-binding protein|nr:single-stranded DNA-binding protein [Candidatus Ancillula sp.]